MLIQLIGLRKKTGCKFTGFLVSIYIIFIGRLANTAYFFKGFFNQFGNFKEADSILQKSVHSNFICRIEYAGCISTHFQRKKSQVKAAECFTRSEERRV